MTVGKTASRASTSLTMLSAESPALLRASSRASSSVCDIFCMILSPSGSSRVEEGHALLFFRGKIPLFFLPHRLEILL